MTPSDLTFLLRTVFLVPSSGLEEECASLLIKTISPHLSSFQAEIIPGVGHEAVGTHSYQQLGHS